MWKNTVVKLDNFPKVRGENKKNETTTQKYKNVIILEKERIVSQPSLLFRCNMLSFKSIYLGLSRFPFENLFETT